MAIEDQPWYWGDANKNVVAQALSNQENGSFIIRDASTPGNYTLSVRANGVTRLARITKFPDGYGFVATDTFDMVEQLVEHYKAVSLSVHNSELDTYLLTGIPRLPPKKNRSGSDSWKKPSPPPPPLPPLPPPKANPSHFTTNETNEEWRVYILLEKLRTFHASCARANRILQHYLADHSKAEALHHNLAKTIAELCRKITELKEICSNQKTTLRAGGMDDRTTEAMTINHRILSRSLQKIEAEKEVLVARRTRVSEIMNDLKEHVEKYKRLHDEDYVAEQKVCSQLASMGHDYTRPNKITQAAEELVEMENFDLALNLCNTKLLWDCERYLLNDQSKVVAAKILEEARQQQHMSERPTDGIFLIRPSQTRTECLCLDVISGNKIIHILIAPADRGWHIEGMDVVLTTIGDLVRYYSQVNLQEQGDELRFSLSYPAIQIDST